MDQGSRRGSKHIEDNEGIGKHETKSLYYSTRLLSQRPETDQGSQVQSGRWPSALSFTQPLRLLCLQPRWTIADNQRNGLSASSRISGLVVHVQCDSDYTLVQMAPDENKTRNQLRIGRMEGFVPSPHPIHRSFHWSRPFKDVLHPA